MHATTPNLRTGRHAVALAGCLALLLASCGGDDADTSAIEEGSSDDEQTTTTIMTTPTPTTEPTTTTIMTTPTPTAEPATTTDPTTTTMEPDSTTPATTTSTATTTVPHELPPLDESGIQYHAQNGLQQGVDEQNSRCVNFGRSSSEGWWIYVDATNGGDFYALCALSTVGVPSQVSLRDANGDTIVAVLESTTIPVPRPTAPDRTGTAIAAEFADGSRRLIGMIQPLLNDTSTDVVQLHIWLPHERAAGDWSFEMDFDDGTRSATMAIDAPCSNAAIAGIGNPFLFDNDLRASGYPFGFDPPRVKNADNCRVVPDVTGLTIGDARAIIDTYATALGSGYQIVEEPRSCGENGVGGLVVEQTPFAGNTLPSGLNDDTVTLTRTATCPAVPANLIGRPYAEVRPELEQLDAAFPDWSWTFFFTGVAAQTCGLEPRIVTGFNEGGPGDYVNPLWLLCEAVYVTGFVFADDDLDGVRRSGDAPPADVLDLQVRLLDAVGNELDSIRPSSVDGRYDLSTQSPGPYRLVVEANPPTAAGLTTPRVVDLDVDLGELVNDVHFGFTN